MTKRTIPAEKPTAIKTEMSINECSLNVVKALEEAQAHADKLAEALRNLIETMECEPRNEEGEHNIAAAFNEAREALAAYQRFAVANEAAQ